MLCISVIGNKAIYMKDLLGTLAWLGRGDGRDVLGSTHVVFLDMWSIKNTRPFGATCKNIKNYKDMVDEKKLAKYKTTDLLSRSQYRNDSYESIGLYGFPYTGR